MDTTPSDSVDSLADRFHRVQVYCRVAPLSVTPVVADDVEDAAVSLTTGTSTARSGSSLNTVTVKRAAIGLSRPEERTYEFDGVFDGSSTQKAVYASACAQLCDDVLRGFNASIMAYGQTGSGKTFTVMGPRVAAGSEGVDTTHIVAEDGLLPRVFEEITTKAANINSGDQALTVTLQVAFVQLYREELQDLLPAAAGDTGDLLVREHPSKGVYIQNLSWHTITTVSDAMGATLAASKNRIVASTLMNELSSRSHAIVLLRVTTKPQRRVDAQGRTPSAESLRPATSAQTSNLTTSAVLTVVDLAGSERANKSFASGSSDIRSAEMRAINLSLTALGNVIAALTTATSSAGGKRKGAATHIPYRNSVLTRILQNSLGGDARSSLIVTVSASPACISETVATLAFGCRAREVRVRPTRQSDSDDIEYWRTLARELQRAEKERSEMRELSAAGSNEAEVWKARCMELQREIADLRAVRAHEDGDAQVKGTSEMRIAELREENRSLKDSIEQYQGALRERDLNVAEMSAKVSEQGRMIELLESSMRAISAANGSGDAAVVVGSSSTTTLHPVVAQIEGIWKQKLATLETKYKDETANLRKKLSSTIAEATALVRQAEEDRDGARDELLQVLTSFRQTRLALRDVQKESIARMSEAVQAIEDGRQREEELQAEVNRLSTMCQVLQAMQDQSTAQQSVIGPDGTAYDGHGLYMARIAALTERVQQLESSRESRVFTHEHSVAGSSKQASKSAAEAEYYTTHRSNVDISSSHRSNVDISSSPSASRSTSRPPTGMHRMGSAAPDRLPRMPSAGATTASSLPRSRSEKSVALEPAKPNNGGLYLPPQQMARIIPGGITHAEKDAGGTAAVFKHVQMSPMRSRAEESVDAAVPHVRAGEQTRRAKPSTALTSAQLLRYNMQRLGAL